MSGVGWPVGLKLFGLATFIPLPNRPASLYTTHDLRHSAVSLKSGRHRYAFPPRRCHGATTRSVMLKREE
jgi:hypothetical protein